MRADGRRVKNANPMYTVAAYIMNQRNDAMNMIEEFIPVEPIQNYMRVRRGEGRPVSHLAVVMAAYIRTVAEYPELNRFVVNKRIYARNELAVGMVVLKPGETDGTMNKICFELEDDVFTVQKRIDRVKKIVRNVPAAKPELSALEKIYAVLESGKPARSAELTDEELANVGISQSTIRLSIGTEHIDDIIGDLEQAFAAIK